MSQENKIFEAEVLSLNKDEIASKLIRLLKSRLISEGLNKVYFPIVFDWLDQSISLKEMK